MMDNDGELSAARRSGKSEMAFRTISEVADELDVPQHVLRFWESKFPQVKPLKRGGGRRYYRPEDVALLRRIRDLLYSEGYTIKGVQKLLREGGRGADASGAARPPELDLNFPADDDDDDGSDDAVAVPAHPFQPSPKPAPTISSAAMTPQPASVSLRPQPPQPPSSAIPTVQVPPQALQPRPQPAPAPPVPPAPTPAPQPWLSPPSPAAAPPVYVPPPSSVLSQPLPTPAPLPSVLHSAPDDLRIPAMSDAVRAEIGAILHELEKLKILLHKHES